LHELTIVRNLLRIVEEKARVYGVKQITGIRLVVGELNLVVPETLHFCFEVASRGTVAQGATLEIKEVPLEFQCNNCGHHFSLSSRKEISSGEEGGMGCPHCHGQELEIRAGRELYLESMEGE